MEAVLVRARGAGEATSKEDAVRLEEREGSSCSYGVYARHVASPLSLPLGVLDGGVPVEKSCPSSRTPAAFLARAVTWHVRSSSNTATSSSAEATHTAATTQAGGASARLCAASLPGKTQQ